MDWKEKHVRTLLETPPFSIEEVCLRDVGNNCDLDHRYYRLKAPSWVNILALTPENDVVLVRQPRVGMMQITLEVPGGGIEDGEPPLDAARRELEEETGYIAGSIQQIGCISPNPAILTNRLYMFLATDCFLPEKRNNFPDAMERITVLKVPLSELELRIKEGSFENALGALTVLMGLNFYIAR